MYRVQLLSLLRRSITRTEGQDLIEYALLVGMIAIAIIASVGSLGAGVTRLYDTTRAALSAPGAPDPGSGGNPGAGNPNNGNPGNGNPGNGNPGNGNPGNGNPGNGNPGNGNPGNGNPGNGNPRNGNQGPG